MSPKFHPVAVIDLLPKLLEPAPLTFDFQSNTVMMYAATHSPRISASALTNNKTAQFERRFIAHNLIETELAFESKTVPLPFIISPMHFVTRSLRPGHQKSTELSASSCGNTYHRLHPIAAGPGSKIPDGLNSSVAHTQYAIMEHKSKIAITWNDVYFFSNFQVYSRVEVNRGVLCGKAEQFGNLGNLGEPVKLCTGSATSGRHPGSLDRDKAG